MKNREEFSDVTKMSSKGQIVVPTALRKRLNIKEGSIFAVTGKKNVLVLRKLDTKMTVDDLRTLKLLEEAWDDIAKGKYKRYSTKAFFKEFKKW